MPFTHLHVHTEYSLLDGAARIPELIKEAKRLEMDSIAITDHGNMFGVVDFYRAALKEGIHPVIGCEVYVAARTMDDRDPEKDKESNHLVLLAENQDGYKSLIKVVSESYKRGFYNRPRVDKKLLRGHSKGLIALSACLKGEVQRQLLNNDYDRAKKEALELNEIFGENNFFLEMQNQNLEEETRINPQIAQLSKDTGIPLVATNDVHYVKKKQAAAHDLLLCVNTLSLRDDENRMRFPNDEFYLKSEKEMRALFPDHPEAIDNTHKIAKRCNVEFTFGKYQLPEYNTPDNQNKAEYLRELCETGLRNRYGDSASEHMERLNYELSVIEDMKFVEYFLIVWDFIKYARDNGIAVGPGRGSGAGSIAAYALQITDIDPIEYGLIFERFLNPERVSMPDFDIDFCIERRGEVIEYVTQKYGEENVAQIITFGTMKARQAIRDVGRALGLSYGECDRIAKLIPHNIPQLDEPLKVTLDAAIRYTPELRQEIENSPDVKQLVEYAKQIEGLARNAGTHAAGIVIAKNALDEYVPLFAAEDKEHHQIVSTQFTMTTVEELGLLKMDFLGLRNLTVIREALEMIKKNHGLDIDFSSMKYDDPKIYKMISSGNTDGIFQLESEGMTDLMKSTKPKNFEDIIAGISLYRPGPMAQIPAYKKNKRRPEQIKYLDKKLEPILSVTYGCMIYQEQVMQIVRELAGYDYSRSDLVRRAMSKKKPEVIKEERENFVHGLDLGDPDQNVPGCVARGVPESVANSIFDQIMDFASYAFNKSHAAAYAVIAYQTAWLKTYYPAEFMAAIMSSYMSGESTQIARMIRNCTEMGIEILPPDILKSDLKFSVQDGKIRFGLLAVKGVGEKAIEEIIKARGQAAAKCLALDSIESFIMAVDLEKVSKKAIENLIFAGAFDCFDPNRAKNIAINEILVDRIRLEKTQQVSGQTSLFETDKAEMDTMTVDFGTNKVNDYPKHEKLSFEKKALGLYISGHPLEEYRDVISYIGKDKISFITTDDLNNSNDNLDNTQACLVGAINSKKMRLNKKNERFATFTLEDLFGVIEVMVWNDVYERSAQDINTDKIVIVQGRLSYREEKDPQVIATKITPIEVAADYYRNR